LPVESYGNEISLDDVPPHSYPQGRRSVSHAQRNQSPAAATPIPESTSQSHGRSFSKGTDTSGAGNKNLFLTHRAGSFVSQSVRRDRLLEKKKQQDEIDKRIAADRRKVIQQKKEEWLRKAVLEREARSVMKSEKHREMLDRTRKEEEENLRKGGNGELVQRNALQRRLGEGADHPAEGSSSSPIILLSSRQGQGIGPGAHSHIDHQRRPRQLTLKDLDDYYYTPPYNRPMVALHSDPYEPAAVPLTEPASHRQAYRDVVQLIAIRQGARFLGAPGSNWMTAERLSDRGFARAKVRAENQWRF
jgi:hypothetical protein